MRATVAATGLLVASAALLGAVRPARAEGGPFGLGVIAGSPTGLSAKVYLGPSTAIDVAVGATVFGAAGLHAHADFLWHPLVVLREPNVDVALYVGAGVRVVDHGRRDAADDIHVGGRAPFGAVFDFGPSGVPIDAFVEAALVVDLVTAGEAEHDGIALDFNTGLGARYYF